MGSPSYMAPEQARGDSRKSGLRPTFMRWARSFTRCSPAALPSRARLRSRRSARSSTTTRCTLATGPARVPRPGDDLPEVPSKGAGPALRIGRRTGRGPDAVSRGEPILARRTTILVRSLKWGRRRPLAAAILAMIITAIPISFGAVLKSQRDAIASELQETCAAHGAADGGHATTPRVQRRAGRQRQIERCQGDADGLGESIRKESRLSDLRIDVENGPEAGRSAAIRASVPGNPTGRRYAEFLRMRNEALIHDTRYTGLDLPGNQEATRREALAALALFADPARAIPGHSRASRRVCPRSGPRSLKSVTSCS